MKKLMFTFAIMSTLFSVTLFAYEFTSYQLSGLTVPDVTVVATKASCNDLYRANGLPEQCNVDGVFAGILLKNVSYKSWFFGKTVNVGNVLIYPVAASIAEASLFATHIKLAFSGKNEVDNLRMYIRSDLDVVTRSLPLSSVTGDSWDSTLFRFGGLIVEKQNVSDNEIELHRPLRYGL